MRPLLITLFTLLTATLIAQGVTITGRIVDSETLDPLPYAHVFIDQTTIGTVTNEDGEYTLEDINSGDYKLVFSFVGYEMYFANISVKNVNLRVSARLVPSKEMLESVEVKGTKDKDWEKKLKQFNRVFFGDNEFAKECTILNPWVLDFTIDWDKTFIATASAPLEIENKALGYKIECTLQSFSFDKEGFKILGVYRFEEINTLDKKEAAKWTRNRRFAYQNSLRFLFKSILDNHYTENGFNLYSDHRKYSKSESSNYFSDEINRNISPLNPKDLISPTGISDQYKITFNARLEVHHTTLYTQNKTYKDLPNPVSWVEFKNGYVIVSSKGEIINDTHITTSGEFFKNRIASMLPSNYSPGSYVVINYITKRNIAKRLQEKIFLSTDKDVYFPNENIYIQTFARYFNKSVKDSLSKVVYIDLISNNGKIISSIKLSIDSISYGSIPAPEIQGQYKLRAYTKWMLNYGNSIIYHKSIFILKPNTSILSQLLYTNETPTLEFDVLQVSNNLKTAISIDSNKNIQQINCSISISSLNSNLFRSEISEILTFDDDLPEGTTLDFLFPIESSFDLKGRLVKPNRIKPIQGKVIAIEGNMNKVYNIKTNRKGEFKIDGLLFYDTTTFSFRGYNKKGKPKGSIDIISDNVPARELKEIDLKGLVIDSIVHQYPFKIFEKDESIGLSQVKNAITTVNDPVISTADYTLLEKDILNLPAGIPIIDALIGRIPSLRQNSTNNTIQLSRVGSKDNGEPIIVVDGNPLNLAGSTNSNLNDSNIGFSINSDRINMDSDSPIRKDATEQLQNSTGDSSIPFANQNIQIKGTESSASVKDLVKYLTTDYVNRVEIYMNGNGIYGTNNNLGVILITTQKESIRKDASILTQKFIIEGFAKPTVFTAAELDDPNNEFLQLITQYWNPCATITPQKPFEININSLLPIGKYLIKVEGLTDSGEPIHSSYVFEVPDPALQQVKARN